MPVFKKKFLLLLFLMAVGIANGKELLNIKFNPENPITSRKGVRKIVKVDDNSAFTHALHLQTLKDHSGTNHAVWTSRFNAGNLSKFVVDYWIKPADKYSRYGLFVRGKKGQLVALLFRRGRLVCCNGRSWKLGPKYKTGKWQHIRYVINCVTRKYDVFLNDMQVPVVEKYKFRHASAGQPSFIWIESTENRESTILLGNVKITGELKVFPPKELAEAPFFVVGVNKITKKLLFDGSGNDPVWKKAVPLNLVRSDGQPICEKSTVKLLWDDQNLYLLFEGQAIKPELRKKEISGNDVKVWLGDCFEFFVDPGKTRKDYCHFAGNVSRGKYDAKFVNAIKDTAYNSTWQVKSAIGNEKWSAEVIIPFDALGIVPKTGDVWGFNGGRENCHMKEVTSWVPLENFHQPGKFGSLVFLDNKYLANQPDDLGKKLAAEIYSVGSIFSEITKQLLKTEKDTGKDVIFKQRCKQYKKQFDNIKQEVKNAKTFTAYFKQVQAAKQLLENVSLLQVEAVRYKTAFAPGTAGNKKGYIVAVENSINKISPQYYVGKPGDSVSLALAGNEYGSFQLALVSAKEQYFDEIKISISDLQSDNGQTIPASLVKVFKIDNIRTALASCAPEEIPDVLREGKNFNYEKNQSAKLLWFDVCVPGNTAAGIYNGTIKVKPAGRKSTTLKLSVNVYGFSLPKTTTLRNIFCFMPYWAEKYYGKKMPEDKRLAYFEFIMEHKLEPVNLWPKDNGMFMNEAELKHCIEHGKSLIVLPIARSKDEFATRTTGYLRMLRKNGWLDKAVFFGHDEVLLFPKRLEQMKKMYDIAKEVAPQVPRMNTAHIDSRLYGYVDIWCPLFVNYDQKIARERTSKGEKVWWYPTDYPLAPYANFNLDSPGIDPRIIPWMNWKLDISGLLYWSINREWKTNAGEQKYISSEVAKLRNLEWLTPEVQKKIKNGLRWPEIPWVPVFININTEKASRTNGGGNLMYPGSDWKPLPSVRLKKLRDGLQDYEYFVILKKNLTELKKHPQNIQLIRECEAALSLDGNVVQDATSYTKDGEQLLKAKKHIAELITRTNRILGK